MFAWRNGTSLNRGENAAGSNERGFVGLNSAVIVLDGKTVAAGTPNAMTAPSVALHRLVTSER